MNRFFFLVFAASVFVVSGLADLPSANCRNLFFFLGSASFLFSVFPFFHFIRKLKNLLLIFSFLCFGVVYAICFGNYLLSNKLDESLYKKELIVEGEIIDLPRVVDDHVSFQLAVRKAYDPVYESGQSLRLPQIIQLSQYPSQAVGLMSIKPNQHWRLLVKLKPIRGLVNFDVQDTDLSSLRRGVGARGLVNNNGFSSGINQLQVEGSRWAVDTIRFQLRDWIANTASTSTAPLLTALAIGDTSQLSPEQWNDYLKTGTNHLIAISGLHVGFFALVGYAVGLFVGRLFQLVYWRVPAQVWAQAIAFALTFFYCLVAGFNIPTVRTLIMLGVVQWSYMSLRHSQVVDSLFLALFLVCLYDPLAAYDRGFWLSFVAVGVLLFSMSGRYQFTVKQLTQKQNEEQSVLSGLAKRLIMQPFILFLKMQWILFVGLIIPLLLLVHNLSLSAPFANVIATPVITFWVVPCLLLSLLFHQLSMSVDLTILDVIARVFLALSDFGAHNTQRYLHACVVKGGEWNSVNFELTLWSLPVILLGVILILAPKGLGRVWSGTLLVVLGVIFSAQPKPALELIVFDVGQGTAVLINTKNHRLLYDTGPAFSKTATAGSRIILPYLQAHAIDSLDKLIISHDDLDHSGGFEALGESLRLKELLVGQTEKWDAFSQTVNSSAQVYTPRSCHYYPAWEWDGVTFSFVDINPDTPLSSKLKKDNNRSCILTVRYKNQSILLPGDIEKDLEAVLLQQHLLEPATLVLAPHHGSHSSSSQNFVNQLQPEWVIYSAGFMSQHGHPHQDIQARYQAAGARALNTANTGSIRFQFSSQGELQLETARDLQKHYWYW